MPDYMDIISSVFPDDKPGYPKAKVLYRLAQEADGPIVEVGCGRGLGSVALALGAGDNPVYAIDPFTDVRGWANEPYGPYLREIWFQNLLAAGVLEKVQSVMLPVQDVLGDWPYPAALTLWDIAQPLNGPAGEWLEAWRFWNVLPGGIIAINETGTDNLRVDDWLSNTPLESLGIDYYIRLARKRG